MLRQIRWCGGAVLALLLMAGGVAAQEPTACPADALLSYVRAGAACGGLENDTLCYGNGDAQADGAPFATTGARLAGAEARRVAVQTPDLNGPDYGVVSGRLRLSLTDPEARSVQVLLFGNATLENLVPPTAEVPVISRGTLRIRQFPAADAPIIAELLVRQGTTAHGRDAAGDWLRVTLPGTLELGWVNAAVAQVGDGADALPVVTDDTPYLRPFQVMRVRSVDVPLCGAGTAANGLLLQTPSTEDTISLTLNDFPLELAGTVFVEADATTTRLTMLEGGVSVAGVGYVPGRSEITLPDGEPAPYDRDRLLGLPGNNLSPRVTVRPSLDRDGIAAAVQAYNRPAAVVIPTATPNPDACRRLARRELTLRAGPGGFYESNGVVAVGAALFPLRQNTDADGAAWFELDNGSWIPAAGVIVTGDCPALPVLDFVPSPPTNRVIMERCETTNGPLRNGQRVTFEFTPPAADNYPDIASAVRTDPGRISVEATALNVRATEPVLIASEPERWVRIYRGTWQAAAGTYRVESRRLSYILICNLTVQAG